MTAAMRLLGAKPNAWIPSFLPNVIAWWDAANASSFTYSSGTLVSAWASRVGSYTLTQATTANQPSRSGTLNSKPTVVFDGTTYDWLSVANFDLSATNATTFWFVINAATGVGDQVIAELSSNVNGDSGGLLFYVSNGGSFIALTRGSSSPYYSGFISGTVTTTAKAAVAIYDAALTTNEMSVWLNGSPAGSNAYNANLTNNLRKDSLYVGSRAGQNTFFDGQICEFGACSSALGSTDRGKLETYLSAKWGLGF